MLLAVIFAMSLYATPAGSTAPPPCRASVVLRADASGAWRHAAALRSAVQPAGISVVRFDHIALSAVPAYLDNFLRSYENRRRILKQIVDPNEAVGLATILLRLIWRSSGTTDPDALVLAQHYQLYVRVELAGRAEYVHHLLFCRL
jgi:hypothetical protein